MSEHTERQRERDGIPFETFKENVASLLELEGGENNFPEGAERASREPSSRFRRTRSPERLIHTIEELVSQGDPQFSASDLPRFVASYLLLPELNDPKSKDRLSPEQQARYMRKAYRKASDLVRSEARTPDNNKLLWELWRRAARWIYEIYGESDPYEETARKALEPVELETNNENLAEAAEEFVFVFYRDNTFKALAMADTSYESRIDQNWETFYEQYPHYKEVASEFRRLVEKATKVITAYGPAAHIIRFSMGQHFRDTKNDAREMLTDILIGRCSKFDSAINDNLVQQELEQMREEMGINSWEHVTGQQVAEAILSKKLRFTYQEANR